MKRLQPLWLALVLLTTLPFGRLVHTPVSASDQGRSVVCYPFVGLLLGIILALLASWVVAAGTPLGTVLLLLAWTGLTGALHLDGLADCCDAWAAGHADSERVLAVMKDPACGPVAVTVLVLVLLLKGAAVLSAGDAAVGLLLIVPVWARAAAVGLMVTSHYRRAAGMATAQAGHLPAVTALSVVVVLALAGLWLYPAGIWTVLLLAAVLTTWFWRRAWQSRIGGYTGDTIGGLIECVEVVLVVVGALLV